MFLTIRAVIRRLAAAAVLAALFSCASEPPRAATTKTPPAWTLETPAPDAVNTYFVGYAEGAGDVDATDAAVSSLIAEILRYIGVTVSAYSTAAARSTLDTFQADLVQTVTQSATSRVSGFQVTEKFSTERQGAVAVYILGRYETADLNAEKRRIAAVFQEKIDAVAVPEAEGAEFLSKGDAVGAARKFIQAAAAAAASDVENAAIKFERNINNAKNALALVTLEKLVDGLRTSAHSPFDSPFKAVVKSAGRPNPGVPIIVGYQAKLANGRMTTRSVALTSGRDGVVAFDHPAPDFVGKATLTMRLDLSSSTDALAVVGGKYMTMTAGLEDEIAAKRVTFAYSVVSAARAVPTAVLIADMEANGDVSVGATSSALLQVLAKNGFNAFAAPMKAEDLTGNDDAAVLAAAKRSLAGMARRLVYGTTRIVSIKDDSGKKAATVSAEIKAVDLSTGRLLYSVVKQAPAIGNSEREAAEAARRTLGLKTIGEDLAANLP